VLSCQCVHKIAVCCCVPITPRIFCSVHTDVCVCVPPCIVWCVILICTFLWAAPAEVAFNRAAAFALSRKSKFDASTTKSRGELHREALVRAGTGMDSARLAILQGLLGAAKVAPVAVALQKSHLGAPVAGGAATPSTPGAGAGAGAGAGGGIGTSASMSSAGTSPVCPCWWMPLRPP
jgi:hypothetical protein